MNHLKRFFEFLHSNETLLTFYEIFYKYIKTYKSKVEENSEKKKIVKSIRNHFSFFRISHFFFFPSSLISEETNK